MNETTPTTPTTDAARGDAGRVVRSLRDGYWERTELVELADGSRRVRKSSKPAAHLGPWGVTALRREIEYLSTLPAKARMAFPPVLAAWDDGAAELPRVGYEMPYYTDHVDAGALARTAALPQSEVDQFQAALADVVLEGVHTPLPSGELSEAFRTAALRPLSAHVMSVVEDALARLEEDAPLASLIHAQSMRLNGAAQAGTRAAFARAAGDDALMIALDREPQRRLHGDLFLENILWRRAEGEAGSPPRLVLIDPVSVAGVFHGPPLFDLVKYESYATGELPALRSEWVEIGGFDGGDEYRYGVRWQSAELAPFRQLDWHSRFRRAFEAKYGAVDRRAYHLIDGYFSLAMAVNTSGVQRRARLLKATAEFNAAT
jgi:hypothetical protein